jgi:hypothetical protein
LHAGTITLRRGQTGGAGGDSRSRRGKRRMETIK